MMVKIKKKPLLVIIVVLVLGTGSALALLQNHVNDSKNPKMAADGINYSPPTEEDKNQAEDHKSELEERIKQEQNPTPPPDTKQVTPTISSWGQDPGSKNVEVAAFLSEVYEDGGICTLTLSKSARVITKTNTAQKDVNRTSCATLVVPYGELEPGNWEAVVSYASSAAKGISSKQTVTVK